MKAAATFLLVLSYLSSCHGTDWTCSAGPQQPNAVQIDAGLGQVVLRDMFFKTYILTGSYWCKLGNVPLEHVTVGPAGIWGTSPSQEVYKYVAGKFISVPGQNLEQVDAGGISEVVGTDTTDNIYCLTSSYAISYPQPCSASWTTLTGLLIYISCGPYGCWGVNSAGQIFVTQITPTTCDIGGWIQVAGAATMVEVGTDGSVFVVNSSGQLYERIGITESNPEGTDWVQIEICLTVISASYDLGKLWLVVEEDIILVCTQ